MTCSMDEQSVGTRHHESGIELSGACANLGIELMAAQSPGRQSYAGAECWTLTTVPLQWATGKRSSLWGSAQDF